MPWPLSQDYNEVIQSPGSSFSDAELRAAEPTANALGIPQPCSGNFADVYEMRSSSGRWAVKCFTRQVSGLRERYAAISRHLEQARLPFIVDFTFLEEGVRVRGQWYPVVKMQWVEGLTLNEFVRQYADKPAMLNSLLQIWLRMAARLRGAGIAHADLQHGNVLLVPGTTANSLAVKLVDYDGMWVPALADKKSGEVGHPNYQHPQRLKEGTYNGEVDRFPLLLVATALDCLRVGGKTLWDKYDSGDNLLFREADLNAPAKSALFLDLLKLEDERAARLVRQTLDALRGRLEEVPLLEEVLPDQYALPASRPATKGSTVANAAQPAAGPAPGPAPARSPWDFDREGGGGGPRPRHRGVPMWVWLAGGAAAVVVAVAVGLAVRNGSRPKAKDGPPVAVKSPGDTDKPKGADAEQRNGKRPKPDVPERPASLPRLVALSKLSLPERGAADLQVNVERQGYVGPIKLQVENLPPGVTCQRSATIPAGESSLRLEFRTDGTAAEGTATVEVIATADMRTADRQKLALLLSPKSAASAKPPEPLPSSWRSVASMPTARILLATVTGPDGRIYAIGGENASGRVATVEVYDPSTNKWTTVAPMPTARNHLAATMGPDNLIYAIGGVSSNAKIVEAYNPRTNKWTRVAPMPTARHGLAAVTGPDGRIYAIGGGGPGRSLNTVEAYDTKSNTWTTVASMPTARVYLAAATGPDGRIYAIGGYVEASGKGKRLNTVEAYDTKTNTWTAVASMPTARNALAAATGPDGRIYAIGGHPEGGNLNPVEAYNPSTNKWATVASMPTVRGQLATATGRDGCIYAIGGGGKVPFLNTVEALCFTTRKP